jgi:ketosteroid isomerase-like protein
MKRLGVCLVLVLLALLAAHAKQKKKESQAKAADSSRLALPLTPSQQINERISEMLAAWQIGDTEMMHKYYADDVTVVSGLDQPLIMGWQNYLAAYERQRARISQAQIVRRNTYVNVQGNVAWASYQWEFTGLVDGKPASERGHTTLIFERRNGAWLIVHNHTSLDAASPPPSPQKPPS